MINIDLYNRTMGNIREKLKEEEGLLKHNNLIKPIGSGTDGSADSIDSLMAKAEDTSFKLLVMGTFSSGKSTFVNVLLGEKLLPEKALPTTALITEINYGEKKKVIMHPKKGKWKGGNEPFEIEPKLSEIEKFSAINNNVGLNTKEANRLDSIFEKMEVFWPLDLLKEGVMIIDSPGTDDPYQNDHIVEEYVPKADAVLYCISSMHAYSDKDKKTLESINSRGFSSPIIVNTYFDMILSGGKEYAEDFINTTKQNFYQRHTADGCCHYVASLMARNAKVNGDNAAYVESGYSELENFLGKYLTENRGKEKITNITNGIEIYNNNQIKLINGVMENLDTPLETFNNRVKDAEKALEQARLQGDLLKREFNLEAKQAKDEIEELIPSLYDKLYNDINLDDFEPDTSFTIWHPKQSSTQIAEECAKEIELRNKNNVAKWNQEVLTPKLTQSFKDITVKMDSGFKTFSEDIEKANISISIGSGEAKTGNGMATNIAMFAYALLTGDWISALLGGVFGIGAFGRVLLCEFTAGFILGIAALFTPIGIPALVIAALAGMIGGVGWNAVKAADSIKNKTVKETRKEISKKRSEIIQNATQKCTEIFDNAEEKLDSVIKADIETVQNNIETIKREREDNAEVIAQRRKVLKNVISFLEGVNAQMVKIKQEFNIV